MAEHSDPIAELLSDYPELDACRDAIADAVGTLADAYRDGGTLLVCGNGGSAADSGHIVGELLKGFERDRALPESVRSDLESSYPEDGEYLADHLQGALPAISLASHAPFLTAYGNDVAADMAFAQGVHGLGRPGDVLLGLSTSGNSENVVNAVRVANVQGLHTVGLTGEDGGELRTHCDVTIRVPGTETAAVQERHLPVYHTLCRALERELFE